MFEGHSGDRHVDMGTRVTRPSKGRLRGEFVARSNIVKLFLKLFRASWRVLARLGASWRMERYTSACAPASDF